MIIFFFFFLFIFVYSYVFFPASLNCFNSKKFKKEENQNRSLIILISAFNEELNIANTINAIFSSSASQEVSKVIIGDDGSSDNTRNIIHNLAKQFPNIELEEFSRMGKPNILNKLVEKYRLNSKDNHLVFMDANISLDKNCLENLIEMLCYNQVGMVGASVIPMNEEDNVESQYILRENRIKVQESRSTGYAIGVFGACFAIKGEYFAAIPSNFITDDLYLTMSAIAQRKYVLYSEEAKAYEAMHADVGNEFRRKKRYAAGNFQILFHFMSLLNPFKTSLGFLYSYFFHKIIRWLSPVILAIFWGISFFNLFGQYSRILMLVGMGLCLFLCFNYLLLTKWKVKLIGYRLYYFLSMNLAILLGFLNYLKGIKSNVWERSDRI